MCCCCHTWGLFPKPLTVPGGAASQAGGWEGDLWGSFHRRVVSSAGEALAEHLLPAEGGTPSATQVS